jgi:hypothetical protein
LQFTPAPAQRPFSTAPPPAGASLQGPRRWAAAPLIPVFMWRWPRICRWGRRSLPMTARRGEDGVRARSSSALNPSNSFSCGCDCVVEADGETPASGTADVDLRCNGQKPPIGGLARSGSLPPQYQMVASKGECEWQGITISLQEESQASELTTPDSFATRAAARFVVKTASFSNLRTTSSDCHDAQTISDQIHSQHDSTKLFLPFSSHHLLLPAAYMCCPSHLELTRHAS